MRWTVLLMLAGCPPVVDDTENLSSDSGSTDSLEFSELPADTWTFLPVDGMRCGNGSDTGIGVNPGSDEEILFFFAGGGACWDAFTCYVVESAVNIRVTWGADNLAAETDPLAGFPLLDRTDPDNPFARATWIYVPYCTADLHIGDQIVSHAATEPDLHHVGDRNVASLLERVHEQIPAPERVFMLGISAGGYGVQLQADRFAQTFPDSDLALLADGAPMVRPYDGRWWEFRRAWHPRYPADCEDCDQGLDEILRHQVATLPDLRFGLLTYLNDAVIMLYLNQPLGRLERVTNDMLDEVYTAPNAGAFVLPGDDHVMLPRYESAQASDGTTLQDWVGSWAHGDGFGTAR